MIERPGAAGHEATSRVLVIGCGSELRSDDAVGRRVADCVEEMALPGVVVKSVVQLVPELALDVVDADRVIVVDADVGVAAVVASTIGRDDDTAQALSHHTTPGSLLGMAAAVGGGPDLIHVVSLPVRDLSVGDALSPAAQNDVAIATVLVLGMIHADD